MVYCFIQVEELENELYEKRIYCTYSIARANSFGMNRVLKQMGYHYEGRLTNNCFMEGSYENLNVWVNELVEDIESIEIGRAHV